MATKSDIGVIYVLRDANMALSKIGITRLGSPLGRAVDYGRVHGIQWFVYWSAPTRNVGKVEAAIHRELHAHRFLNAPPGCREVFYVLPQQARAVALRHVIAPDAIPWRLRLSRKTLTVALRWAAGLAVILAVAALSQN